MEEFSKRYEYEPENDQQQILESAPDWIRLLYLDNIMVPYFDSERTYLSEDVRGKEQYSFNIDEISDEVIKHLRIVNSEQHYEWDQIKALLMKCAWFDFYNFVEAIARKLLKLNEIWEEEIDYLFPPGVMDSEEEEYTTERLLGNLKYRSYPGYQQNVNDLFEKVQVMWELDENANLVKRTPDEVNRLKQDVQEVLKVEHPVAYDHLYKSDRLISRIPLDPENSITEIVSAVESLGRELFPEA